MSYTSMMVHQNLDATDDSRLQIAVTLRSSSMQNLSASPRAK